MTRFDPSNVKQAQQGEAYTWTGTVAKVNPSDLLVKGYLTLKTDFSIVDGSATLQKTITVANVAGTGQITNAGAGGTGAFRFDLTAAQMSALAQRDYLFDIKVITAAGIPVYATSGLFRVGPGVTNSNT